MNKDIEKLAKDISNKHGLPTYDPVQWHHIKNAMCEMYNEALKDKEGRDLEASDKHSLLVNALRLSEEERSGLIAALFVRTGNWENLVSEINRTNEVKGRELNVASDNTNLNVPCVTPLYCNNSIEQGRMCMSKLRSLINSYDKEEISISKFLEEINNHFLKQ